MFLKTKLYKLKKFTILTNFDFYFDRYIIWIKRYIEHLKTALS